MKKTIKQLGAAIALVVVLVACGKEQAKPTSQVSEHFKRVESVDDERLLFSMLTVQEKTDLATQHLDFCAEYYNFTDEQLSVLASIKSKLLAVYSSSDPENAAETAAIQLDVNQYFSTLTEEQRLVTFSSMAVDDEGVQAIIGNTGTGTSGTNDCNCSSSSNYCSSSWGPSIPCSTTQKCLKSTWGCGTVWAYSCNGKCKLF